MKMLIKYIAIWALSFSSAIAANWTGSAVEPENMKKIDGKAFYVITSAEELAWFANQINSGNSINGALAANVTLGTTYAWTPIGKDSTKMFQNIFDGGNYTITAPYTKTGVFAGLFGVIGANGVVKNVKVANPSITHTRNGGAIAGFNNGTIDNVSVTGGSVSTTQDPGFSGGIVGRNKGLISNTSSGVSVKRPCITRVAYAGGIAGYNLSGGTLSSVSNNGSVYACKIFDYELANSTNNYVGGITAYNAGLIKSAKNTASVRDSVEWNETAASISSYTGGVAGYNTGNIDISYNYGIVQKGIWGFSLRNVHSIGGITGCNKGTLNRGANFGELKLFLNMWKSDTDNSAKIHMGGISGYNTNVVKNSKNEGSISYSDRPASLAKYSVYSGGIVGTNDGSNANVLNNYSTAKSVQTLSNGGGFGKKGGVAGQNINSAKINNSNFDQTLLSTVSVPVGQQSATISNSGGKSTADMKKDQFAWILNTTNGTTANSGAWSRTDGYPIFATEDNKAIYKVVFNDDGVTSNRYTNYKGFVSFPEAPEPAEGYIFSGWYNTDEIKVKPTTVFTADQTVKAIYTDASDIFWTITFYNAAPADTVLESKSYQHGSIVAYGGVAPTLASTAQYSYTFKGWDVEPTNAIEDFEYHAVYDSTVRAYAITFNNYDDSKIESATFEYGKMASCSMVPTRAATAEWKYSHKGWRPALDYVTEAATYTAIYDSSKVEYKVTFMNGTIVIDEQMVPYGDAAVAPTNVTREGYKFVGWNTSFAKVTEALTVKALFEELIIRTVNVVDGEGDKIANVTVEDGETYTLPEAPKKDGYTFDAYYDGDKKLGVAGDEIAVTANITIIAKYIANPKSSSSSVVSSSSETPKSSSSKEIATNSSSSRNDESSSSKTVSSSSTAKSCSSAETSSSSSVPKSSSSSVKSSSSSKANSSSSTKTDAIVVTKISQFSIQVDARNVQISAARIGDTYMLFDMQGRVLLQGRVQTANFEIPIARSGNYLIRIGNNVQRIAVK